VLRFDSRISGFLVLSSPGKPFSGVLRIFGGGGSRTRVLIRDLQASTGLAVYRFVGAGLAKQRASGPYSGKSCPAVSESGGRASPGCDAEAVPQSGGTVPRGYAAKA